MSAVYAGTSGWSYPQWKPAFYPAKLAAAKFLSYYATRLNTVEVNYTFRRFPTAQLLAGWVGATPDAFRFAVKAHQSITHVKRLRDAKESLEHFSEALEPLRGAGRLGPVLFQLPPFLKRDPVRLADFLDVMPPGLQTAFEFRHESWFEDEIFALLRKAKAALCQAESEKLETPYAQTTDFSYLRLRKQEYSPAARRKLAEQVARLKSHGDVFVYFKHEDSPEGALYAEKLLGETR
jgi:uncharacterized protein YecE (DUF72 family)